MDDYARALREMHAAHLAADAHLNHANMALTGAAQHAQAADTAQHVTHEDAHANAGQIAIDAGVDHAIASTDANQEAARKTAELALKAKTEAERAAAVESALKVVAREKEIADALVKLGVGQCGVRSYARVTPQAKDALIAKLHGEGMTVTGTNPWGPWDIDTHKYGVKLRAVWNPKDEKLWLVVVIGKGAKTEHTILHPTVTCEDIWDEIEPKLREVIR
jgi:hypothetical protein